MFQHIQEIRWLNSFWKKNLSSGKSGLGGGKRKDITSPALEGSELVTRLWAELNGKGLELLESQENIRGTIVLSSNIIRLNFVPKKPRVRKDRSKLWVFESRSSLFTVSSKEPLSVTAACLLGQGPHSMSWSPETFNTSNCLFEFSDLSLRFVPSKSPPTFIFSLAFPHSFMGHN